MSLLIALGPGVASAVLQHMYPNGSLAFFDGDEGGILNETQAWSGFSFLVGFLIVFRTSQAYNRFWEGCTASHQMRAEWFDACSSIVSFTKYSKADARTVRRFKELLIRLTSMLHAAALAELERGEKQCANDLWAHKYDLIDPESIDSESLETIKGAQDRVELIFEWIQQLIVESIDTGVLSIPPPLLSRSFQELATGMVQFHNAMKIAYIPLPFPYAQTCDCLLIVHMMVVPVITSQWVTNWIWAFIFTLIQVLVLWSLNLVALEIENPFGQDANDMDGGRMQEEINRHLLLLLDPATERTPRLSALFDENRGHQKLRLNSTFERVLAAAKRNSITSEDMLPNQRASFGNAAAGHSQRLFRFSRDHGSSDPTNIAGLSPAAPAAEAASEQLAYACHECGAALMRLARESADAEQECSQCCGSKDKSSRAGVQSSERWRCKQCRKLVCGSCVCTCSTTNDVGELCLSAKTDGQQIERNSVHGGSLFAFPCSNDLLIQRV